MALYNKVKWILGILLVFVLIVATNLIDRKNFRQVRDSVVTIYEDRLIASDLIIDMSQAVQEKELAIALGDTAFFSRGNNKVVPTLKALVERYEQTKLTKDEAKLFSQLRDMIEKIPALEENYKASGYTQKQPLMEHLAAIQVNLNGLSKIQLVEGNRQKKISQRAIDSVELFTQIEIFMLILMAIVIQIIVIYKPKE